MHRAQLECRAVAAAWAVALTAAETARASLSPASPALSLRCEAAPARAPVARPIRPARWASAGASCRLAETIGGRVCQRPATVV